jgi:GntR family transcriptional regulator
VPREIRYRAIARDLGRRIETGELPPGERLPTEDQLAEQYGVHRLTARQAVVELRKAGLVETRHGSGSYVRQFMRRLEVTVDPVSRLHRAADLDGMKDVFTQEEVTGRGLVTRPAGAQHLGLSGGQVLEITTLLRTGGTPCVTSSYRLPPALASLEYDPALGVPGSLQAGGYEFHYSWHAVSADVAGLEDESALEVEAGAPILVREGLLAVGEEPLCHIERRCRGDLISFVTRYD